MAFTSRIPIRFGDEDHARIVYYPRFFHFFHTVFEDFFNEQGFPYRRCLDVDEVGWPAVHVTSDFESPLRFGDVLELEMWASRVGDKSVTCEYIGRRAGDEEVAVRARVIVACIDLRTYAARPIPPKYRELFEHHLVLTDGAATEGPSAEGTAAG